MVALGRKQPDLDSLTLLDTDTGYKKVYDQLDKMVKQFISADRVHSGMSGVAHDIDMGSDSLREVMMRLTQTYQDMKEDKAATGVSTAGCMAVR